MGGTISLGLEERNWAVVMHSSLPFLIVDVMWSAPSSSCCHDFPTMMETTLELWARVNLFFLTGFYKSVLSQKQEKKLKR